MVARVAGRFDDKVGERRRKGRRATIKALPAPPHRPRPYGHRWAFRSVGANGATLVGPAPGGR